MLKGVKSAVCPKEAMKNNKPSCGKSSGNITVSKSHLLGISSASSRNRTASDSLSGLTPNAKKESAVKPRANTCSSSQESLTGGITSVRRKTVKPVKPATINLGTKSENTPIRMLNNLQSSAPRSLTKKSTFKRSSNMRRAVSKDSVDLVAKDREKENVKIALGKNTKSSNCITILQLEKEKSQMEQQISELVKNSESKKAEIATLKMEINKLKDLKNEDAVEQLRQELENVQLENRALKKRLLQFGVPLEMTALSDNQKEQILIQRSLSGSFLNADKGQSNCSEGPKSLDSEFGEASGLALPGRGLSEWERGNCSSLLSEMSFVCLQDKIMQKEEPNHCTNEELQAALQELAGYYDKKMKKSTGSDGPKSLDTEFGEASGLALPGREPSEWERGSSSSLSEMSFACLQDKIIQMEETNHCTNEELQATLQELTDLQDQLSYVQVESERMTEEKDVLLESLCSQTEKLEECRMQITQLKQLLFQQPSEEGHALSASERECNLVDLLKKAQEAHDVLLMKQEELAAELQTVKNSFDPQTDLILLRDRVKLLESTVESINADKRLIEKQLGESQEQLSAYEIEISQLKLQLENEQQKVSELQREREAEATSELNALLQETRSDKEKVEEKVVSLQEQLALTQREVARYKDHLQQLQEENMVAKNNAHKQISDLEYQLQQLASEKEKVNQEMSSLDQAFQQLKMKCQHHLEDKRELKASVGELQKAVNETTVQLNHALKEMEDMKAKHKTETDEWNKFQADLLTTVRVANDFKTEAQHDVERLVTQNKQLIEKNSSLSAEIEVLKAKQVAVSPTFVKSSLTFSTTDSILNTVDKDLTAQSRRQLAATKRNERGAANQLSVRSLIESIENATKHAKGPSSSCSSSSSSINSIASDSRIAANSILLGNNNDIFIKPSIRSTVDNIAKDAKIGRLSKNSSSECIAHPTSNNGSLPCDHSSVTNSKVDGDSIKTLSNHPVSILSGKLDPMRRNSYGDISEKDPLSSLVKGGGSKRNALLKWCQNKSLGYKGIDITNFSSSWNDGLAFCALLHSYLPNQVPYHELDSKDKKRNFTLAFQAAESVGIPTTLNINDLISQERPDWQSIMTYVTSIYKHFET